MEWLDLGLFYLKYKKFIHTILIILMAKEQYYQVLLYLIFPSDQDKVRQAKAWKLKLQYCSANEKPSKVTKHKQISEFCNKMMYLLTWNKHIFIPKFNIKNLIEISRNKTGMSMKCAVYVNNITPNSYNLVWDYSHKKQTSLRLPSSCTHTVYIQ